MKLGQLTWSTGLPMAVVVAAGLVMIADVGAGEPAAASPRLNRLHVVYITTHDREPLPGYRERLHRIMVDVQDFYREEMQRNGYGPRTFELDFDAEGRTVVHLVTLPWDFDPARSWRPNELRPEVIKVLAAAGIDADHSYFVAFENAYWQDGKVWKYDVVYTGAGDPSHGATWVADHAWLDAANFDPRRRERLNDRGQTLTMGQFNVKMIGGVAHELGHALGLPHNRQQPDELRILGNALMGAGNYTYRRERLGPKPGAFLTVAHAFALSLHPLFSGKPPDATVDLSQVRLENLSFEDVQGKLMVAGTVKPAAMVAGIVVYHDELPTGINRDYDADSYLARLDDRGRFAAAVDLPKDGEFTLHLRVYARNGYYVPYSFQHRITGELHAGLAALRGDYRWQQVKAAFARNDAESLAALVKKMEGNDPVRTDRAKRFLALARQWTAFPVPSEVPDETTQLPLSAARWRHASVGWFIPAFDHVVNPEGDAIEPLASATRRGVDGLYAHAAACYEYDLGGRWSHLRSHYGLQAGHQGTVVFVVLGDGRELFRSPLTSLADGEQALTLDVSGVRTLSLVTEPGPDGKNNDWGIWFEPELRR